MYAKFDKLKPTTPPVSRKHVYPKLENFLVSG